MLSQKLNSNSVSITRSLKIPKYSFGCFLFPGPILSVPLWILPDLARQSLEIVKKQAKNDMEEVLYGSLKLFQPHAGWGATPPSQLSTYTLQYTTSRKNVPYTLNKATSFRQCGSSVGPVMSPGLRMSLRFPINRDRTWSNLLFVNLCTVCAKDCDCRRTGI